jgi:hypothetical protein
MPYNSEWFSKDGVGWKRNIYTSLQLQMDFCICNQRPNVTLMMMLTADDVEARAEPECEDDDTVEVDNESEVEYDEADFAADSFGLALCIAGKFILKMKHHLL